MLNLVHVGYFPKAVCPPRLSKDGCRAVKVVTLSRCLEHLLKPMKELSFSGVKLPDPWGQPHMFFPQLISYVADNPEVNDISCSKGTNTKKPCIMCQATHDQLHQVMGQFASRTEASQRGLYTQAMAMTSSAARKEFCKEESFHPIRSGLWGFNFWDNPDLGGSCHVFGYESMHNAALGVFLYLVDNADVSLVNGGRYLMSRIRYRPHRITSHADLLADKARLKCSRPAAGDQRADAAHATRD